MKIRLQTIWYSVHSQACDGSLPESRLGFGTPYSLRKSSCCQSYLNLCLLRQRAWPSCDFFPGGCGGWVPLLNSVRAEFVRRQPVAACPSLRTIRCYWTLRSTPLERHLFLHHWHKPALLFPEYIPHPWEEQMWLLLQLAGTRPESI